MLLLSLDAATASQLLRAADPEAIRQIAAELAYLQTSGHTQQYGPGELAQDFCDRLDRSGGPATGEDFVRELLAGAIGERESKTVMDQIANLVQARDPFLSLRSAPTESLAAALDGESPQAIAVLLSELSPAKSAELLAILPAELRMGAVCGMTNPDSASREVRLRIANVVEDRLRDLGSEAAAVDPTDKQSEKLRKVAVLLRGLEPQVRDSLLEAVDAKDEETGQTVRSLMIIWEDVLAIADRSLQEVLREIDSRKMALALADADEATNGKFRENMSERAGAMLDAELSLLSAPGAEEVEQAREGILASLRELNNKGELNFEGD